MNNREALERIASYPSNRSEEMSIETAREIARAALASQAQQTESQWISVEERLPDEGVTILVTTNFGDIYTCRLPVIIAKNSKEESPEYKRERFTHWMPLPPAPEGDKP